MEGLKYIENIRAYCDYIEAHLLNVQKAWEIVQEKCKDMNIIYDDFLWANIDTMIKSHDVSKCSPEEFIQYQRYFYPVDKKDGELFGKAWDHHVASNPHHWENWTRTPDTFPNEWCCHCVCMVCDWMAMGMHFGDTAQEYYESNKDKINIPDSAIKFIYEIFNNIGE